MWCTDKRVTGCDATRPAHPQVSWVETRPEAAGHGRRSEDKGPLARQGGKLLERTHASPSVPAATCFSWRAWAAACAKSVHVRRRHVRSKEWIICAHPRSCAAKAEHTEAVRRLWHAARALLCPQGIAQDRWRAYLPPRGGGAGHAWRRLWAWQPTGEQQQSLGEAQRRYW